MRIPGSDLVYFHFSIFLFGCPISTKGATPKTGLESSVFGIEKEVEIWMSHF